MGGAYGVVQGEGGAAIVGGGLPREAEGQALLLQVLFPMGEEGVALQLATDAPLWTPPADASPQLQAKAGFCITIVLPDVQRHGGEVVGPMGKWKGSDKLQPQAKAGEAAL